MNKTKNTPNPMDEILGGGSMKDLINGVVGNGSAMVSKDGDNHTETSIQDSTVNAGNLDTYLNYYLRAGIKKQAVYVDVELIKELEKLIYKLKYSGGVRSIPKSSLVCAILKSYIEENRELLK